MTRAALTTLLLTCPAHPATSGGQELEHVTVSSGDHVASATRGCASFCLAIAARRLDAADVSYDDVDRRVDPDGDGVASIGSIVDAARGIGLRATPRRAPSGDRLPRGLAILHVRSSVDVPDPDHFVVSDELSHGRFRIFQPPVGTSVVGHDGLDKLWNGDYIEVGPASSSLGVWRLSALVAVVLAGAGLATRIVRPRGSTS